MNPQEFVAKWKHVDLKESTSAQSHFNGLRALIGHPHPRVKAIAQAAHELIQQRDAWLSPLPQGERTLPSPPGRRAGDEGKRTLTPLYNEHPTWLDLAHRKLDEAVFDAYGWPHDIRDEEILARLLALNLKVKKGD